MFDWSEFLDRAEEPARCTAEEAALRIAIGRAYYAAFGAAGSYLIGSGAQIPRTTGAHDGVWHHFDAVPNPVHYRIAGLGESLAKRRRRADDESSYPDLPSHVEVALRFARRLLADIANLP